MRAGGLLKAKPFILSLRGFTESETINLHFVEEFGEAILYILNTPAARKDKWDGPHNRL